MGTLDIKYTRAIVNEKYSHNALSKNDFDKFNVSLLGLGNITQQATTTNALAAVFDLEDFTSFCGQIDPQLVIPEYLNDFLKWLFSAIATRSTKETRAEEVILWGSLPFFGKFMGDGVLFLWNTDMLRTAIAIGNIVVCLRDISIQYEDEFFPTACKAHAQVPSRVRVGIARGQVFSIGGGQDYVGPCINMAARLQKLGHLPFAFSRRGFDPNKCFVKTEAEMLVTLKTSIRGMGGHELIVAYKNDYNALPPKEQKGFTIVGHDTA